MRSNLAKKTSLCEKRARGGGRAWGARVRVAHEARKNAGDRSCGIGRAFLNGPGQTPLKSLLRRRRRGHTPCKNFDWVWPRNATRGCVRGRSSASPPAPGQTPPSEPVSPTPARETPYARAATNSRPDTPFRAAAQYLGRLEKKDGP